MLSLDQAISRVRLSLVLTPPNVTAILVILAWADKLHNYPPASLYLSRVLNNQKDSAQDFANYNAKPVQQKIADNQDSQKR